MQIFRQLDRLLREVSASRRALGTAGAPIDSAEAEQALQWPRLILLTALLGLAYGLAMGLFGLLAKGGQLDGWLQLFTSGVKVPLLFLATLAVTFPSLYVVATLAGSHMRAEAALTLILTGTVLTTALLASLGPVTAFFTLSSDGYAFIVVLNVLFFLVAGGVGLGHVRRTLRPERASRPAEPARAVTQALASMEGPSPIESEAPAKPPVVTRRETSRAEDATARVFGAWTLVYGIVAAQMGWILRPFVGAPDAPFTLFRPREGSILRGIGEALGLLFGL